MTILRVSASSGAATPTDGSYAINLGSSGLAVSSTGTTTETTLATVILPGNLLGANGAVRLTALFSHTNSANNKFLRIKIGSTIFVSGTVTTSTNSLLSRVVTNRNATNSQICWVAGVSAGGSGGTAALVTGSIDTTIDNEITFAGQLANAADSITLESYLVEVFPAQ